MEPTIVVAEVVAMNDISFVICCETTKFDDIARPTVGSRLKNENTTRIAMMSVATNELFSACNRCMLFI
jgi:hypothetical protein